MDFKFHDYYQSVNIDIDPVQLEINTAINSLKIKSTLPDIETLEVKLFETLNNFDI